MIRIYFSLERTIYDCSNDQLCNFDNWLTASKLSLSIEKTNDVVFRTPNSRSTYDKLALLLRNKRINRVTTSKFLGVILREKLSWEPRTNYELKKLRISLGVDKKISSYRNCNALTMLYNSMSYCHILHCITTWCFGNKTVTLNLQRAANTFMRLINRLNCRDSVKQLMLQSRLMSVEQTLEFTMACFTYRYNKDLLPTCFNNFFQTNSINCSVESSSMTTHTKNNSHL